MEINKTYTVEYTTGRYIQDRNLPVREPHVSRTITFKQMSNIGRSDMLSNILGTRIQYIPIVIQNPRTAVLKTSRNFKGHTIRRKTGRAQRRQAKQMKAVNLMLSICILFTLMTLLLLGKTENRLFHVLGYSVYSADTDNSYEGVPGGALVIIQDVDPSSTGQGENFTYQNSENAAYPYDSEGFLPYDDQSDNSGFPQQDVESRPPEQSVLNEGDESVKVQLYIPVLGRIVTYAERHIIALLLAACFGTALTFSVKLYIATKRRAIYAMQSKAVSNDRESNDIAV